jgi:catalase-peroxidase
MALSYGIVLAANIGIEQFAKPAGISVTVSFASGCADAKNEMTNVDGFAML